MIAATEFSSLRVSLLFGPEATLLQSAQPYAGTTTDHKTAYEFQAVDPGHTDHKWYEPFSFALLFQSPACAFSCTIV